MTLRKLIGPVVCSVVLFGLQGCGEKKEEAKDSIRGLRAYKVSERAESRVRRFPSILQPADISVLSFEVAGQLKAINLQAGQKVQLGDLLAETEPRSLQAQVELLARGGASSRELVEASLARICGALATYDGV